MDYPVEYAEDLFGENAALADFVGGRRVLIVADQNVVQRTTDLGTRIGAYVKSHQLALAGQPVVLAGSERVKLDDLHSGVQVARAILNARLEKDDFVLALGGGAVLDVAGWAAVQVCGGVRLIRVPTTPVGMLGGALGEFAALDAPMVKDALQIPCRPAAVFIDFSFAETVLDGVWRGGAAEAVRLALDKSVRALSKLQGEAEAYARRDAAVFRDIVERTVTLRLKKGGTSLGLAAAGKLEAKSNWKLPYGYAVAIGILIELRDAVLAGTRKQEEFDLCLGILRACGALDGLRHSQHILPPEIAKL